MKRFFVPIIAFGLLSIGCDQLGIDPNVNVDDCLTESDVENYAKLVKNEKDGGTIMAGYEFDPELVPESERQTVYDDLTALNGPHDTYRKNFECQYWGEDTKILTGISEESKDQIDATFLNPSSYKQLFKIESSAILEAINQEDWDGKDVYIFPGISRIPWEGASQANKEKAIKRINDAYNDILVDLGEEGNKELFDPINDYVFPHATFHQVFVSQFASAVISPNNLPKIELVQDMATLEKNVVEKFINRAPDTIDLE
ncbi:MAG: hypothetical protein JXQ87_07230 [Bacteroidia bacterium]